MRKFEIKTQRLVLNTLNLRDAERLFNYRTSPQVLAFQSWHPDSILEVREFIQKFSAFSNLIVGCWNQIAIRLNTDMQLIGDCGVHLISDVKAEIGYTIAPQFQRNGYATEAVQAVCDFLFTQTKVTAIQANTLVNNKSSIAVLRKLNFKKSSEIPAPDEHQYILKKNHSKNANGQFFSS